VAEEPDDGTTPSSEDIARRAYEIWLTEGGATPEANWERAERELREALARGGGADARS
jgi:hypothetical protein